MAASKAKSNPRGGRGGSAARAHTSTRKRGKGGRFKAKSNPSSKVVYLTKKNGSSRPRKNSSRGGRGYFRNPNVKDAFNVVKQLGFGGLGAFAVSTVTQIVPIQIESRVGIFISQLLYAIGIGYGATRLLGREAGQTVRIGAFAFVAGNAVQMFMPNLQDKLLSYSPVKAKNPVATLSPAVGAAPLEGISDVEEINPNYFNYADVQEVGPGQFSYS